MQQEKLPEFECVLFTVTHLKFIRIDLFAWILIKNVHFPSVLFVDLVKTICVLSFSKDVSLQSERIQEHIV